MTGIHVELLKQKIGRLPYWSGKRASAQALVDGAEGARGANLGCSATRAAEIRTSQRLALAQAFGQPTHNLRIENGGRTQQQRRASARPLVK
jgi:hypothetical protein